jgi:hypothetical protein
LLHRASDTSTLGLPGAYPHDAQLAAIRIADHAGVISSATIPMLFLNRCAVFGVVAARRGLELEYLAVPIPRLLITYSWIVRLSFFLVKKYS